MIISETVLLEKFDESEEKGYDYLIDNAETDEQIEILLGLQKIARKVPNEIEKHTYTEHRNIILEEIGVNISMLR